VPQFCSWVAADQAGHDSEPGHVLPWHDPLRVAEKLRAAGPLCARDGSDLGIGPLSSAVEFNALFRTRGTEHGGGLTDTLKPS